MKKRYITGFDGLRTLAVVGVILYHIMPFKFQGGFLGVPIFLVLSGYLITDHLVLEYEQTGTIDLKNFYIKRIKRLYPGLITMLMATTAYITLFQRQLLVNIRGVIVTNLLYVYNWFEIAHGESYFDKFGNQSPFTHLWTLAIEGQFYLFWPLIMLALLVFVRKKQPIFDILFIGSFVSALLMAVMFHPNQDPSRVYYGTDTRLFSIFLGASLAIIWPSGRLRQRLDGRLRLMLDGIGIVSLLLMLWMFMTTSGQSDLVYRGGMYFFSLLATLLIATVAHPGADLNRMLSNPVFTWVGRRSYGIYIYQYPVLIFYESAVKNIAAHPWLHAIIEIIIICLISEFSYRCIEKKLSKFDYSQTWQVLRDSFRKNSPFKWRQVGIVTATAVTVIALFGIINQPDASAVQKDNQLQQVIQKNEQATAKRKKGKKLTAKEKQEQKAAQASAQKGLTAAQKKRAQTLQVTAVGDSVMADGMETLQNIFPQMYVDAKVGRQVAEIVPILQALKNQGKLADTVLIGEGTNGPFTQQTLDQIMTITKGHKVYWINVHVPTKNWQNQVNSDLEAAAKKYHNLTIIDWYSKSNNHPDWFYSDNVHPNSNGLKYYGDVVARAILKKK